MSIAVGTQRWDLSVFPPGVFQPGEQARTGPAVSGKAVWVRPGYESPGSVIRAAWQVRARFGSDARYVVSLRTWRAAGYWAGDIFDDYELHWCARCGGLLDWADDMWICTVCGDEWDDEQVRPWTAVRPGKDRK
jgi:hypothetical protein